jgi:hypothetical protein
VSAGVDTGRTIRVMDDSIVVATASRQGTCGHNADAAPWFASAEGRTAAAVVDGIGNSPTGTAIASLLAQVGVVCLTRACAVAVLSSRRVPNHLYWVCVCRLGAW